jgi:hypothetical protein
MGFNEVRAFDNSFSGKIFNSYINWDVKVPELILMDTRVKPCAMIPLSFETIKCNYKMDILVMYGDVFRGVLPAPSKTFVKSFNDNGEHQWCDYIINKLGLQWMLQAFPKAKKAMLDHSRDSKISSWHKLCYDYSRDELCIDEDDYNSFS